MNWGLYIHVPFCISKCPYCDFYSTEDLSFKQNYTDALIREMSIRGTSASEAAFDTVYIGGGTPSTLSPWELSEILETAFSCFNILPGTEITVEVNPGTAAGSSLEGYRSAGANRLNIGVQSFNDENLAFLGRIHSARDAADTLTAARRAGFENIGLDLIYGMPGQNKGSWQKDLTAAAAFSPSHISCYMLTIEEGTKMAADMDAGRFIPLGEEQLSSMFVQASKFLSGRGYEHYEISNYAASRKDRSRHNQKYWQNAPYIGLGPAAHSYVEPKRFWNCKSVDLYIKNILSERLPPLETECLTRCQRMIEALYLGLRRFEGIDIPEFERRFETDFKDMFAPALNCFIKSGHLELGNSFCRLTPQGMLMLDTIASDMAGLV